MSFLTIPNEPGLVTVTVRTVPARSDFLRNGLRLTLPEALRFVKTTGLLLPLTFCVGQPFPLQVASTVAPDGMPFICSRLKTVDLAADGKPNAKVTLTRPGGWVMIAGGPGFGHYDHRGDLGRRPGGGATTVYVLEALAVLPALSAPSTVNVCVPADDVSIGLPEGTGPAQELSPEPPASSVQP